MLLPKWLSDNGGLHKFVYWHTCFHDGGSASVLGNDTGGLQGWEVPDMLSDLKEYNQRIRSRDSWKQTYYPEEKVVQGWKAHIEA